MKAGIPRFKHIIVVMTCVGLVLGGRGTAQARIHGQAHVHTVKPANACLHSKRNTPRGTVRFSDWQFPAGLNGYQTGGAAVQVENTLLMFESLFVWNNKNQYQPQMATTAPTFKNGGITNKGRTITLHLRPGLRWSNGAEITSADVKFGWHVDMDPATGPACLGACDIISRIDTPNKYTVVFRTKRVDGNFLHGDLPDIWPTSWSGAWSKGDAHAAALKLAQDKSFNFEGPNFPTNGPYQVREFVTNDRITFSPMKYYNNWACGARIGTLIFAFYSSKPGMIAAAASNQTDTTTDYTEADIPQLKQNASVFKTVVQPGFLAEHLELNLDPTYNGQPNPLSNLKVRQALALALDRYGLVESALGMNRKEASNVVAWDYLVDSPKVHQLFADPKILGQWDPIAKKYTDKTGSGQALADAKKLLAQTPYKGGFSLEFHTTSGNPVRANQESVIAASWAKIGVIVTPMFDPAGKLFAAWPAGGILKHGQFQVGMFAYVGSPWPFGLTEYRLGSQFIEREHTDHPCLTCSNTAGIKDPLIDRQIKAMLGTLDTKKQRVALDQVQIRMNQQAYWIPLFYRSQIDTSNRRLTNWYPTASGYQEWNASEWGLAR